MKGEEVEGRCVSSSRWRAEPFGIKDFPCRSKQTASDEQRGKESCLHDVCSAPAGSKAC